MIAWLLLGSLKALTKILYGIDVSITIEPVEGDFKRYRYFFTQKHEEESSEEEEEEVIASKVIPSTVADLKMSPATFCKAFPWHFIMNENLELVQMGKGFTKLYKSSLQSHGRLATTYFRFKRPMGLSLKFREIVRRTNTPFLIALKVPAGKADFSSEVKPISHTRIETYQSYSIVFFFVVAGFGNQRPDGILPRIELPSLHWITISGWARRTHL